jgi:hypothetical protein
MLGVSGLNSADLQGLPVSQGAYATSIVADALEGK